MDKVLLFLIIVDLLFLGTGGVMVGLSIKFRNDIARSTSPTVSSVAENLLLMHAPLNEAIANGGLVFFAFLISLPALALQFTRGWLKAYGWLVIASTIFTLVIGLSIWFSTLRTRSQLQTYWAEESSETQSLLQRRFNCCGYIDAATPSFRQDSTCTNALVAAQKPGCMGSFSDFANRYLNRVFTVIFGFVALDVVILLGVAVLLRDRLERARFHYSDLKNGLRSI
ncbi:MAG: phospholipid scramblase 1 [Peltula sp. TS41687]|nr:MAG: phospholipid scramblase 1 [Peltula sp. TS41687]